MRWWGVTEGAGLPGNGSSAGCAGACGVRGMYCGGSTGSSTGSPWNIGFFPFFFSEWLGHKYPTLSLSVQNLAMGAGSVPLEARSLCIETDLDVLESQ